MATLVDVAQKLQIQLKNTDIRNTTENLEKMSSSLLKIFEDPAFQRTVTNVDFFAHYLLIAIFSFLLMFFGFGCGLLSLICYFGNKLQIQNSKYIEMN
jgi:hypothetical protein